MNFRTFSDLNRTIFSHFHELPKDIDIVAGIPRSGLLAANIIALYLNLPLTDIDSLSEGRLINTGRTNRKSGWVESISEARRILVVDDSANSGSSIRKAKEKLSGCDFYGKIIFMAVYAVEEAVKFLDAYFEIVDKPRMFEWNYLHHSSLSRACFDIDGVLCPDPTEEENDDGEKYIEFIRNVPARFTPTFEIGCLVTSRLEKYREETEYWLRKNNIRYGELIMMNLATKEERIASGSHGRFKAEHYMRMKRADIFVESNPAQAEEIAAISGKSVFCTDNQQFETESTCRKIKHKIGNRIARLLPRRIKDILKVIMR